MPSGHLFVGIILKKIDKLHLKSQFDCKGDTFSQWAISYGLFLTVLGWRSLPVNMQKQAVE